MINNPQIGIWWIVKDKVEACFLDPNTVQFIDGWKDISISHFDYWNETLKSRLSLPYDEYTDHPRGRVLLKQNDNSFVVYGSSDFFKNNLQKQFVLKAFNLKNQNVKFCHDSHYDQAVPLLEEWDEF